MKKSGSALAAVFTPRGRGAVATILCRDALHLLDQQTPPLFQAANQRKFADQKINQVLFGQWGENPSEDVVVCRIDESTLEIHCHGGQAAVNRILSGLESIGCLVVTWQAFDRELKGIFHSEIQNALAHAQTCKTAAILLDQQSGCLENAIQDLIEKVEALQDQFEEIAYERLQNELLLLIKNSELGRHLVEPFQVVLAGKPNVGKSSLINALVGYDRSIVYDMPGTTRDAVSTETAFNGWPVELTDTAGLRQTADELESAGIEIARNKLQQADCRILLFDISQPLNAGDVELQEKWSESILVAHKCDLADLPEELKQKKALPVSSTEMTGIEELVEQLQQKLVPHEPEPGTPFPFTERQVNLLNTTEDSIIKQEWEAALKALKELIS